MHIYHATGWLCCPVNISPQTADVAANFQFKEAKEMSSGSKERPTKIISMHVNVENRRPADYPSMCLAIR